MTPKLVFRPVQDKQLTIEYGLAYYPGCFTPTGIYNYGHLDLLADWCKANRCGQPTDFFQITFENESDMSWFLLRWA